MTQIAELVRQSDGSYWIENVHNRFHLFGRRKTYEDCLILCEEQGILIREYEFLHGYNDLTVAEIRQRSQDSENDPLFQELKTCITKEINKEILAKIKEVR